METPDLSEIQRLADLIAATPDPWATLDEVLSSLTTRQKAIGRYDWPIWARSKQIVPQGPWRSFGLCSGMGFGKTRTLAQFITEEVRSGRAGRVGLCAQNMDKTFEVMVDGKSGLLEVSPPWFKARWINGHVEWPNGATAHLYTPERPGAMKGPEHDLVWMGEVTVWPRVPMLEAFTMFQHRCRLGYAKVVWDTNPRKRHLLLRRLFERHRRDPARHIIVTGSMRENIDNLSAEYVEEQYAELAGTMRGAEDLEGRYFDDDDDALFREAWFELAPRELPDGFKRRILCVDPAITSDKRWSDATGIVDMGLGHDGQIYAIRNDTGVHRAEVWPGMVVDRYVAVRASLIWLETNRGGDSHVALLRVACRDRKLNLVVLGETERPEWRERTVFVRPINTKGKKVVRAEAAANLMERGRVSFVKGGHRLEELRDRLLAFDGTEKTPDNEVDAFVHGCVELAGLALEDKQDGGESIREATEAAEELRRRLHPSEALTMPALVRRARAGRI